MKKLAVVGVVVAGLIAPAATSAASNAKAHKRTCCSEPIFQQGKNVSLRGPQVFRNTVTVYVRDPVSGKVTAIPYGKYRTEDTR